MILSTPLTKEKLINLKAGDLVYLSGTIYTMRDQAHKKIIALINKNQPLPFDIENSVIYYVGPTPTKPGEIIGSCGPTSSYRMDSFIEPLLQLGLSATIGKGERSLKVIELLKKHKTVHFSAVGGVAAYLNQFVIDSELVAFKELQSESIKKLIVKNFPLFVTYDIYGNDIFKK